MSENKTCGQCEYAGELVYDNVHECDAPLPWWLMSRRVFDHHTYLDVPNDCECFKEKKK